MLNSPDRGPGLYRRDFLVGVAAATTAALVLPKTAEAQSVYIAPVRPISDPQWFPI